MDSKQAEKFMLSSQLCLFYLKQVEQNKASTSREETQMYANSRTFSVWNEKFSLIMGWGGGCTLELALKHRDIRSHKSYCMTCSFKNSQDIAASCYLGTADSPFACMCWKDRCHVQHSASKLSILFALAWTFTQSWLIALFAQEKLQMGFRNSFVGRFSLPFPWCVHMHTIHCTWGVGDEENKAFNWFSGQQINTAAWSFDNYQLSTRFIPRTGRTKAICYFPCASTSPSC